MQRKGYIKLLSLLGAAVVTALGLATAAYADEPIKTVSVTVTSSVESDSDGGSVSAAANSSKYKVVSCDFDHAKSSWKAGETPKVNIELEAEEGYYFNSITGSKASIKNAEFLFAKKGSEKSSLTLVVKLKPVKGTLGDVEDAYWEDTPLGKAKWSGVEHANAYEVKLFCNDHMVYHVEKTASTKYDFFPRMTEKGEYYYKVRAIARTESEAKYLKAGDWTESGNQEITLRDAQLAESQTYSGGATGGSPSGTPGGNPSGPSGGGPSGPSGTPGGHPSGTPGGNPSGTPGGNPSGTPGGNPSGTPGGNPSGPPGGNPSGPPGSNPSGTPGTNLSGTSGGNPMGNSGSGPGESSRNTGSPMAGPAGWQQDKNGWWYENADHTYPVNCWKLINDKWYLFNQDGYMLTGWQKKNDRQYYLTSNGDMVTGWLEYNRTWYYLDSELGMLTGGWYQLDGDWYYMNPDGSMATGWIRYKNNWYYLDPADGRMVRDRTVGSYYVNADGIWVP